MPEASADLRTSARLRALADDAGAVQSRLREALDELELTPELAFRLGEAFASLGAAARTLYTAADEASA
ncbi:hypothetical protein AB0F39_34550 [Streptomyces murinus]|uniref:hypothetical protein n=1 Tax=Streptomyces murinus TaxID=33900 RepID=UPI0033D50DAD